MTVNVTNIGRLNRTKNVEGLLQTLYAFLGITECAQAVADKVYANGSTFHNDATWRQQFPYSDARLKQAVAELREKGLTLPTDRRGSYRLNPSYFLRGEYSEIRIIFREDGQTFIDYDKKN
jgi:hypothetical protein